MRDREKVLKYIKLWYTHEVDENKNVIEILNKILVEMVKMRWSRFLWCVWLREKVKGEKKESEKVKKK